MQHAGREGEPRPKGRRTDDSKGRKERRTGVDLCNAARRRFALARQAPTVAACTIAREGVSSSSPSSPLARQSRLCWEGAAAGGASSVTGLVFECQSLPSLRSYAPSRRAAATPGASASE